MTMKIERYEDADSAAPQALDLRRVELPRPAHMATLGARILVTSGD
jgi:hypothetical protein